MKNTQRRVGVALIAGAIFAGAGLFVLAMMISMGMIGPHQ